MLALVTGGGGFLGRYVVRQLLDRGDRVRILARGNYPDLAAAGVECLKGDIRDTAAVNAACANADVVYHTAGVAGIWGPWDHFYSINVQGTENVLAACHKHGVTRLVYTSSPSVTFDGSPQCGVDESAPYPSRWLCHYPHTKAIAEQKVLAANDANLATCALRPHLIWGPGDQHLIPRLISRAKAGRLLRVGDGINRIDMVYVENAANAHLLAADALCPGSPVAGRAYFITQGEPVNCWGWINDLLALAGLPPVSRGISLAGAWRVGSMFEGAYHLFRFRGEPAMTRFLAAQLGVDHWFDITRAKRDFGYEPAVSTDVGMQRLAASWRGSLSC